MMYREQTVIIVRMKIKTRLLHVIAMDTLRCVKTTLMFEIREFIKLNTIKIDAHV